MKRKEFLKKMAVAPFIGSSLKSLSNIALSSPDTKRMPVLFVGHGNPMNAVSENEITRGWRQMAHGLQPSSILCISAHWETRGTFVNITSRPETIHDFGGFPKELFEVQYPVSGSPELAYQLIQSIQHTSVMEDHDRGLDHGAWSVLIKMFPDANVPVFQMSLDTQMSSREHYLLGKELSFLRRKGVLIVGSGNVVHNLRMAKWTSNEPYEWATAFDEQVKELIQHGQHDLLLKSGSMGSHAQLSVPTIEHYLPMLYTLALQEEDESASFFNETIDMGSMSMRSFVIS